VARTPANSSPDRDAAKASVGSAKKAAAPTKKAAAPTKKAAAPTKKAAAPTKKATAPTKKATAPTKKATAPTKKATARSKNDSGIEVEIRVERQKAAQAAGNFELADLPGPLGDPAAAIRIGKNAASDKALRLVRSINGITQMHPGQVIANYGKSEAKWATDFNRRRANRAEFMQLLSYSRQIIGIDSQGKIRICLMGHAGQGQSFPLWVVRDEVVLTVQPNDIILRFEGLDIEE
jgi:hypothetical protein